MLEATAVGIFNKDAYALKSGNQVVAAVLADGFDDR